MVPRLFYLIAAVSGYVSLSFELIWIRQVALYSANTVLAASTVVAVFFLSAAGGSFWAKSLLRSSKRPLTLYIGCELAATTMALLLLPLTRFFSESGMLDRLSPFSNALCSAMLLAAIPSFLAAIPFPALSAHVLQASHERLGRGGLLYGFNLVGAALGVLGGGWLGPYLLGYETTVYTTSGLSVLAVAVATRLRPSAIAPSPSLKPGETNAAAEPIRPVLLHMIVAVSGMLVIGMEILLLMWFKHIANGSLYLTTSVFFGFLLLLATGAALASWADKRLPVKPMLTLALLSSGIAITITPLLLHWGFGFIPQTQNPIAFGLQQVGFTLAISAPAIIPMGAIFPLCWACIRTRLSSQGEALGHVLSLNKLAAAIGAIITPLVLIPYLGFERATPLIACLYSSLGCLVLLGPTDRAAWRQLLHRPFNRASLLLATIPFVGFVTTPLPITLPKGHQLLEINQSAYGSTATAQDAQGGKYILLNNQYQLSGTGKVIRSQRFQSWIPLSLVDEPKTVLTIGMASGISATAALDFPIEKIIAIELVPEVVASAKKHFADWNTPLFTDERSTVLVDDGRAQLRRSPTKTLDAVICDLFFPTQEGTADLYSKDFVKLVKTRLNDAGVYCLWLPAYQLDTSKALAAIRPILEVFPHVLAFRGNYDPYLPIIGIAASASPFDLSDATLKQRIEKTPLDSPIHQSFFFNQPEAFQSLLMGDLKSPKHQGWLLSAILTTDDQPLFSFLGPIPNSPDRLLIGPSLYQLNNALANADSYPSIVASSRLNSSLDENIRAGLLIQQAANAAVLWGNDARSLEQRMAMRDQFLSMASATLGRVISPAEIGF